MGLHDIDSTVSPRLRPNPATHDTIMPGAVMAHGTNSTNYATGASNTDGLAPGKNGQFTIVGSGTWTPTTAFTTTNPGAGNYVSNETTLHTEAHNLGYVPSVLAYLLDGGLYLQLPFISFGNDTGAKAVWITTDLQVDSSNVYINIQTVTYGNALWNIDLLPVKWFLLQQTAN